jgi:signal transduction histidine kinase
MQKVAERGDRLPTPKEYARIHLELGKIRKVVDSFVKFARTGDMALRPMDLGDTMAEAVARYQPDMSAGGVTCRLSREGDLVSVGDREKLLEVFAAVIQNALDSMRGRLGGDLRIRVDGRRGGVRITVRDSGEVTDEGSLGNIFEPSFSHRDTAMGLGMTVARTFVESHGGTIAAGLAQGGGCVVTIDLPRRRSA